MFLFIHYLILSQISRPDHVVLVIFENRGYPYLIGNTVKAPFINSLLADSNLALFTQSYALTNPSQPNYLMLYSGYDQGVTTDTVPGNLPFTSCNLGANLLAKGFTIVGYSESLPSVGFLGNYSGPYMKRHNPIAYWQGTGMNNTPANINRPYSDFPNDYNSLPDVSIVIPNIDNSMHDGGTLAGDEWFKEKLQGYINWTRTNNSLLILTFDEDDGNYNNHILTFFYGPMVKGGSYNSKIDHYNVLRTIEEMYGLSHCGNSAAALPITDIWKNLSNGITGKEKAILKFQVFPIPTSSVFNVVVESDAHYAGSRIILTDAVGRVYSNNKTDLIPGRNDVTVQVFNLKAGIYLIKLQCDVYSAVKRVIVN
jgi:phosphatidylinositol-3-phosphatase